MEDRHTKMYKAMADVQSTSIAAIQATSSPASIPRVSSVGAMIGTAGTAPEVMIEQTNMAMLKLTGILKSKDKAWGSRNPHHVRPLADGDIASICSIVCILALAATIGGTSLGSHSGLQATKLDSHANMAVAGIDCTVIATSGHHATVTPFFSNFLKWTWLK